MEVEMNSFERLFGEERRKSEASWRRVRLSFLSWVSVSTLKLGNETESRELTIQRSREF